jgi:hypothetical protein
MITADQAIEIIENSNLSRNEIAHRIGSSSTAIKDWVTGYYEPKPACIEAIENGALKTELPAYATAVPGDERIINPFNIGVTAVGDR